MFSTLHRFFRISLVAGAALAAPLALAPAQAASPAAIALNAEQTEAVQRINAFLNSYQSLKGDFVQISPKGRTTRGVMLISKPGKLRFEYEPPNPLLIVSDGKWLTIKNKTKEKGDQVPLSSTPLRLIVAPKVNILSEASVVGFEQAEGVTTVTLAERNGGLDGQIVLIFDDASNQLQQWIIVDGKGQRTTVQLGNLERDVAIDPKVFAVTIKRKERDSK